MYPVGRNGMHRYNNQDHSMLTAMLSVENIFGENHDCGRSTSSRSITKRTRRRSRRHGSRNMLSVSNRCGCSRKLEQCATPSQ